MGNTQRGIGAGVIFSESSNVTITASVFEANRNMGLGAGTLYAFAGSTIEVTHSQFKRGSAKNEISLLSPEAGFNSASVVVLEHSSMTIEGSEFDDNVGQSVLVATSSTLDIAHTAFTRNVDPGQPVATAGRRRLSEDGTPSRQGATVSLWAGSVATLAQSSFAGNSGWSAGALFVANAGTSVSFDHMTFSGNQASSPDSAAGAIHVSDGASAEGMHGTFAANMAASQWAAGAIYANSATVTLSDVVFTANQAEGHGTTGTRAGSGVLYADSCAVSITRAAIQNNKASGSTELTAANYADALYVLLPTSVEVMDSTFRPMLDGGKTVTINPGSVAGVIQGGCNQHPCALGSSCRYANYSTTCTPCAGMSYSSDGIACQACPAGFGPKADKTNCELCAGNNHSAFGVCLPCPSVQVVVAGQTRCEVCPMRQTAVAGATSYVACECGCTNSFHNGSQQLSVCFDGGYETAEYETALAEHNSEVEGGQFCERCPTDALGQACYDCVEGTEPTITTGYTIPQLPSADASRRALQQVDSQTQLAFRCHNEMDLAIIRCPADPSMPGECSLGYQGFLCQTCAEDYGMMPSRLCEPCAGTGFTTKSLLILVAIIVGVTLVVGTGIKYWRKLPFKLGVRCAFQPMRIVITYAQVTSQLGDVLSFEYPPAFAAIVDAIRPIMDVWGLLFRALGSSECFGLIGFTSKWTLRVVVLPMILSLIVATVYCIEKGSNPAKAGSHAKGNLFFAVFFVSLATLRTLIVLLSII